jgi:epsilon-lactone hydrolase
MDAVGPSLAGTRIERADVHHDGRRVVGEWVRAPGVPTTAGAIYFVHGSGFALCSPRTHRRLTSWLSRLTGLAVFAVDYRLAPRHRFPTAADDVRAGGGRCTLQVWPDQVHVFQALPRLSPEAVKAMKHVARFIDTSMRDNGIEAISGKAG